VIGRTIGRYRIVAKLGEGGMGSVWRAEDTLLERPIALKFLPEALASVPDARHRLLREARAASALDHPGIATVYDAGEADGLVYIALQYVDGETVGDRVIRGRLPIAEAAHVARCAAESIGHAHSRGVLHRDITARNIMVARDGRVLVVDFGLALPEGKTRLTTTGAAMGTAAYMAPEVAQGGKADRRTDVYGLGVVLYEMLTGTLPFTGERSEALLYAVVHEPAEPPSKRRSEVPPTLDRIVLKALAKDPANRYPSAELLAADLRAFEHGDAPDIAHSDTAPIPGRIPVHERREASAEVDRQAWTSPEGPSGARTTSRRWQGKRLLGLAILVVIAAAAVVGIVAHLSRGPTYPSVAVLPFRNLSEDKGESDYLSEGIGEALVTKLTQIPDLRVTPWPSVQRYTDLSKPMPQIARELNVSALIIGTFQKVGDRIHGTLSLVDGGSGTQSWADEFEQPISDLFAMQRQIAIGAATKLKGRLTGNEERTLATPLAQSVEAYEFYRQGAHAMTGTEKEAGDAALAYFQKAVELDPKLVEAYVGIGAVSDSRYFSGGEGGLRSLETAQASFEQALRLNPESRQAQLGLVLVDWEYGRGEDALKLGQQVVRSSQESADDLLVRASAYLCAGLTDKAVLLYRRLLEIDPANSGGLWYLVAARIYSGQFREALTAGEDFFRRFGEDAEIHNWVAVAHHALGNMDQARTHYEAAIEQFGEDPNYYVYFFAAAFYKQIGQPDREREILSQGLEIGRRRLDAYPDNPRLRGMIAGLYGYMGDKEGLTREEKRLLNEAPDNGQVLTFPAMGHAFLGETDRSVELLRRALRSGCFFDLIYPKLIRVYGAGSLEGTPAYADLLREFAETDRRLRSTY
jgi:serine/threonine-protein kinase